MARSFGIRAGDMVRLLTRRGDAVVKARLARTIRMDTLFVPFHWGGKGCANLLTNAALDPDLKNPGIQGLRGPHRERPIAPPKH